MGCLPPQPFVMSNVLRPVTIAPIEENASCSISAAWDETLNVISPLGATKSVSPLEYQSKSRIPPSPKGCSSPSFGPAIIPSSDIVSPEVTLPMSTLLPYLVTRGYLLHTPAVAVRVAEEDAPHIVQVFSLLSRAVSPLVEDLELADIDASLDQLGAGGAHIPDDQEHAVYGAWFHIHRSFSQMDRARGPGRGQLNEAEVVADPEVDVHLEPNLLGVEISGAINVRDRDRHDLYLPVHSAPSARSDADSPRSTSSYTLRSRGLEFALVLFDCLRNDLGDLLGGLETGGEPVLRQSPRDACCGVGACEAPADAPDS